MILDLGADLRVVMGVSIDTKKKKKNLYKSFFLSFKNIYIMLIPKKKISCILLVYYNVDTLNKKS